jgi:dihydroorotate dehydrogenase subfamily 1
MAMASALGGLSTRLFGIELQSPFIVGSGPLSFDGSAIVRAHRAGAGAVTTKTIRDESAKNAFPHLAVAGRDSLINAEKWSDLSGDIWVGREIPMAKDAGAVVIASIGHTAIEVERWVGRVDEAGADIIELVSYDAADLVPMVMTAKRLCHKPVLAKISPNWADPAACAEAACAAGADGITAMDSVGPVLRIDIRSARPLMGGENGSGWLSGAAIKPIALRYVAEIAARCHRPIVGTGGVIGAEDAVEMLMAGATAVGICTALILRGIGYIEDLCGSLAALMGELGYGSIASMSGISLPYLGQAENRRGLCFKFDETLCTVCGLCSRVCAYEARKLAGREMRLDEERCRRCGLCASVCPTGALSFESE